MNNERTVAKMPRISCVSAQVALFRWETAKIGHAASGIHTRASPEKALFAKKLDFYIRLVIMILSLARCMSI